MYSKFQESLLGWQKGAMNVRQRGPTVEDLLARDTPSTRPGGRGCRARAVLVARVDAGPSDLAVWYIGTLGMKVHKLAKKILEARLELATFCV